MPCLFTWCLEWPRHVVGVVCTTVLISYKSKIFWNLENSRQELNNSNRGIQTSRPPILLQALSMQPHLYLTTVLGLGLIEVDITVLLWKVSKGAVVPVWSPLDAVEPMGNLRGGAQSEA